MSTLMPLATVTPADFVIDALGAPRFPTPLASTTRGGGGAVQFLREGARVALDVESDEGTERADSARVLLERAGPRERVFFGPGDVRAGIVTCGGLSPGINDVVRAIVLELHHRYEVRSILGFRYGYEGLDPESHVEPITLDPEAVRRIHKQGGSLLGVSRGKHRIAAIVDHLVARKVNLLFAIGGGGTLAGAAAIHREVQARGLPIAVVGVPKTIDNDVHFVDKTFGFDTAVELAREAIDAAHSEATAARNGIGLVKLMGRDSGFITASATLASNDVNICLVPEVPFRLRGPGGLLVSLERRLRERSHAVIVVGEGCGASLAGSDKTLDESGNVRYASPTADIGPFLREAISEHFSSRAVPITLKYIDPSYMVRSGLANATDSILCSDLGRHAVHAGMAGKTGLMIGCVHGVFAHVPLRAATQGQKRIDPKGPYWSSVLETTGQPSLLGE
jgi:6-phosphofructokinase 1